MNIDMYLKNQQYVFITSNLLVGNNLAIKYKDKWFYCWLEFILRSGTNYAGQWIDAVKAHLIFKYISLFIFVLLI